MNATNELSGPLSPEEVSQFHRNGFVIHRGLFQTEELRPIQQACADLPSFQEKQTRVRDGHGRTYKVAIWTNLDDSLLGKLPRTERIVRSVEVLLDDVPYHWHSKVLRKQPGDGAVGIHQDYATWYEDGCLYPRMLTCTIALDKNDKENGCVYFVPGSHRMARIHRVCLHGTKDTHGPDPARAQEAIKRQGMVYATLEPGDVIFFHCNTLHGSEPNRSDRPRTVIHCSYNSESNQPLFVEGQEHHRYRPLQKVTDDFIHQRRFAAVFHDNTFHSPENDGQAGAGLFYRNSDRDVAPRV